MTAPLPALSPAAAAATATRRRRGASGVDLLVGAITAGCWAVALLAWWFGWTVLLDHQAVFERDSLPLPVALLVFLLAWQVMTGAMMLPTTLPLARLFARAAATQPKSRLVLAAFLAAYFAVWTAFAAAALGADLGLHRLLAGWPVLAARHSLIAGLTVIAAGAFQFSPLKEQCLRACRHPMSYLLRHYGRGPGAAWRLGLRHALFCLGCCWALMLVMFAVGAGNLAIMAALTGIMLVEKTQRWGGRLVPFVGAGLLLWGAWLVLGG